MGFFIFKKLKKKMKEKAIQAMKNCKFDVVNLESYTSTSSHQLQRSLYEDHILPILNKSESKIAVTNGHLCAMLMDLMGYEINPNREKITLDNIYEHGEIDGFRIFVDPSMSFVDNKIFTLDDKSYGIDIKDPSFKLI